MPLVLGLSDEERQNYCELFGGIELFSDTYVRIWDKILKE